MILRRLYELAVRENLLDDPAFEFQPIPFVIVLREGGELSNEGIVEQRGDILIPSKKKGGEPKKKPDSGRPVSVPRAHGNSASQGFARFFADTIARVVPMSFDLANQSVAQRAAELAKRDRSRATFWRQIDRAADETDDPALRAVQAFGRRLSTNPDLAAKVEQTFADRKAKATDRCTFHYALDRGPTILNRDTVRAWYSAVYREYTGGKQTAGPTGLCQITERVGPIPLTHPIKLDKVPGWMSMGVALISYDKAAFESYGLEGTANASVGYEAADAYGAALRALVQNKLSHDSRTSIRIGESLFLFWTREPEPTDFMELFESPTTEAVAKLLAASPEGQPNDAAIDENEFYCLALSSNAARVIVRDYLEESLPKARANVAAWFRDLKVASTRKRDLGYPIATFPLWVLAASMTAPKSGNQPDWPRINDQVPRLMAAALKNNEAPLPDSILASCLQRLRAEGSNGFRPARMALLKLCLIRKGVLMSEKLDPNESNPAYVCGELLAVFDQIQRAALGNVNATVVDKYYGGFSAAPLTALGVLFENAQNHLRSLRSENAKRAAGLDKRLALTVRKLKDIPEGQLSLADQTRFALGYYHAKAERIERWAELQQQRALEAERKKAAKAKQSATDTQA